MPGKAMVAATLAMLTIEPPLPAAPPGRMARRPCFMPERGADDVDLEHAAQVGRVEVDDERGDLDAGVVDQDVEAAELGDGRRRPPAPSWPRR